MATTFKMAALNVIFRRRSSLFVNCYINRASNFEIDHKSGIKLHLVKYTDKTDNLKEWVPF